MELPKQNRANRIGRKGVAILTRIVEIELDWNLRLNHLEDDFGIDAYIDLVTKEGNLTGKSIALQIKSGESYFKQKSEYGWKYHGENRHLNYYLNHDIPVVIVIVDTESEKAFWVLCDPEQTEGGRNGWTITIPFENEITTKSKSELENFVSPTIDYVSQLEDYWETNKLLKSSSRILLIAGREDIESENYQPIIVALNRIASNKDLLYQHKENIEISIHGYNDDPRELHQIKEVKKWVTRILDNVKGLSFFLVKKDHPQFIKLLLFSQIKIDVVKGSEHIDQGRLRRKVEFESKDMVEIMKLLFNNLNEFCEANRIPLSVNKEISTNIIDCFTEGEFSKDQGTKPNSR